MDAWAWVEHPVTGGSARIARSSLAHHLLCGWVETAAPEPAKPADDEVPSTTSPETSRRRAGKTKTGE